ncbi:MAG: hypothetical protein KA479_09070 [Saprospiraceae bacterium]|jgi:hypothetical protein|nr:hypothetical protein [Saprospiraceae bacterium]
MYQFLNKYGQVAAFGLGTAITLLFFIQIMSGISTFEGLSKEDQLQTGIFNFGLGASIFLVILCTIAIIGFGIVYMIKNSKESIKGLVPFLVLIGIFLVSYAMAKPATEGPLLAVAQRFELTAGQEKFIVAGLSTSLILLFGATIAFIAAEIRNFFK